MEINENQLEDIKRVMGIQGADGNWNYDAYMHGMYNGMEMIASIVEGREAEFKDAPAQFLETLPTMLDEPTPANADGEPENTKGGE